ncbi:unnamed protein product [Urochloa decumbens]|uniref:Uncharacterized protein n=1 Tax=Urochloa decumbens TaxID=240449 RepID=A0ABC9ANF1_9POAL
MLDIEGYKETKGFLGVGNFFSSCAFTIGGHSWSVRYYPDGKDMKFQDYISVYLERLGNPGDDSVVMARFKFSLVDETGEPWHKREGKVLRPFFDKSWWGFDEFFLREDLESSSHIKDDRLTIRCDATIVKNVRIEIGNNTRSPVLPPSDLHQHLGDLLKIRRVKGDVKFKVGGKKIRAHRNVLAARSSVFTAELFGKMKETKAARVRIKDMEPGVFEAFLHFIYTDSLPEIDEGDRMAMAQHLLVVADRYHMEMLKLICEIMLRGYIDTDSAATTLVLAEQHGCHGLKQACLRFIAFPSNMKVVMMTEGFEYLTRSFPSLLKELAANIPV